MPFNARPAGSGAAPSWFAALLVLAAACSTPSDPTPRGSGGTGGTSSAGSNGMQDGGAPPFGGSGGKSAGMAGRAMTSAGAGFGGAGDGGASASSGRGGASGATGGGGATATGGSGGMGAAGSSGAAGAPPIAEECEARPAGDVTFSVPSGAFEGSLSVELSTELAGAEIRYTTDRTAPTPSSTLYAGTPIAISSTTQLVTQLFVQGVAAGPAQTAVYIARAIDSMHDLPVIVLDTYGTPVPGQNGGTDEYVDTALLAFEPNSGMTSLAGAPKVASAAGIHVRGQSSSNYAKKPYRVELHEADGTDRDCPMLGMPSESDWVLHSPFPDKALIRNAFVYSLGRDIGMAAPRAKFAEVYVNSSARPLQQSDYVGVYLLVEKVKNQKDRLNLQQLEPTDTTLPAIAGGYIFKFEWRVMNIEQVLLCPSGQENCWDFLEVYDPKPWNTQQQEYLAGHLQSFVDALHSATPSDETTGYPAFLDVRSFATQVIIHELTRNLDAYTRSQYFFKDRDGKINAGPLWDYDLTAGVGRQASGIATEGWQHEVMASRFTITADWFPRLIADPAFNAVVVARWKELRQAELSDAQVTARIASLSAGLAAGAARNFEKWDNLATATVGGFDTPTAATWDGQVTAMRDWLLTRMAWLDTVWV